MKKEQVEKLIKETPVLGFGWALEGDRIAVLQVGEEEITSGGIIIPGTAREKPQAGYIAQLGHDVTHGEDNQHKHLFHIGQVVLFGKYAGSEVTGMDGKEYMVMRVHDILAFNPKK